MLWLLASESSDGHFDGSAQELAFRLRQSEKEIEPAIKALISNGFFVVVQDASNALAERQQDATPERETDERQSKRQRTEAEAPDGVSPQTWADFLALRKAKNAPVTKTVLAGASKEAAKAGMTLEDFLQVWCRRGSQGLEAAWLKPEERRPINGETAYQRSMREKMQALVPAIAAKAPMNPNSFIDAIEVTPLEIGHGNH